MSDNKRFNSILNELDEIIKSENGTVKFYPDFSYTFISCKEGGTAVSGGGNESEQLQMLIAHMEAVYNATLNSNSNKLGNFKREEFIAAIGAVFALHGEKDGADGIFSMEETELRD